MHIEIELVWITFTMDLHELIGTDVVIQSTRVYNHVDLKQ